MKKCPYCAEDIQDAAIVCKHCGRDLVTGTTPATSASASPGVAAVLSLVIPGAGTMYAGRVGTGIAWLLIVGLFYVAFWPFGAFLHLLAVVSATDAAKRGRP